jgi:sulfur-oxidizing protein SoxY
MRASVRGNGVTRRQAVAGASIGAIVAALLPRLALADPAAVEAEIKKLYGDRKAAEGRVKLDLPQIAENGLVVPIGIEVDSPMTEADHVKAVHVFADGNPLPRVVTYRFTPTSGKAAATTRMRLAQTQNVICLAEMSNGQLFTAQTAVKVTIGGCGG